MLIFILYNSGLELLSSLRRKELNHPSIKNDIKRRKKKVDKILLDLAIHQSALQNHSKINRGRPDIVHLCILQYLFSRLVSQNSTDFIFKFIVHSINNTYFEVPHSWKPPTHFYRFRGLLEQLLEKQKLKVSDNDFINLKEGNLKEILDQINFERIFIFTSHGEPITMNSLTEKLLSFSKNKKNSVILIGGYQHGGFPKDITNLIEDYSNHEKITLHGGRLPSWKILNDILSALEYSQ